MNVHGKQFPAVRRLALAATFILALAAPGAEAQTTTLIYEVTATYSIQTSVNQANQPTQTLSGILYLTIPAINPTSSRVFDMQLMLGNQSTMPTGTLNFATNQRFFSAASGSNANLATTNFDAASSGSLIFTATASAKVPSFQNSFIVPPLSVFGTNEMFVNTGGVALIFPGSLLNFTGTLSLGGSSNPLMFPTPSYYYEAKISGSYIGMINYVPTE